MLAFFKDRLARRYYGQLADVKQSIWLVKMALADDPHPALAEQLANEHDQLLQRKEQLELKLQEVA